MIPPTVLAELNRQLNHELAAAYAYQVLSTWCVTQNLSGFAEFFAHQAEEERDHAQRIIDHIIDRRGVPEFVALPAPPQEFGSLGELAQRALQMEQANTRGIHAVYEAAVAAKDYPGQVLMHWFIAEQVEEEAWAAELVERVRDASCAGGLSDLDRHIVRILIKEKDGGSGGAK